MNRSHGKKASIGQENQHRAINKFINPDNIRQSFYETGKNNHKTSSYDLSTIEDDKTLVQRPTVFLTNVVQHEILKKKQKLEAAASSLERGKKSERHQNKTPSSKTAKKKKC